MSFLQNARDHLLRRRNGEGHWTGELSSSALSTATAVMALHFVDRERHQNLIRKATEWLADHQNEDGGWGDTTISLSNISTTLLVWSALALVDEKGETLTRAAEWIRGEVGSLDPDEIKAAVVKRYGKDRTFSVPILMACALGGRLGPSRRDGWCRVLPLPFELAVFPRRWFGALKLPVVSYALPALIAIGYARLYHAPPSWPFRLVRRWAWKRVSPLLATIQPASGGYLEATPLTSFVLMALAGADQTGHPVVSRGEDFLLQSIRQDGSWPIDTNLATWTTTLATKALLGSSGSPPDFPAKERKRILAWLLAQQYRSVHPFTVSPPGGWAWTDLSGGVPDADDTAGALLAIHRLGGADPEVREAARAGIAWLLGLQNRDGGIPTFCRGWGTLPFDRSSPDISAHALRALTVWREAWDGAFGKRIDQARQSILRYLRSRQNDDGSWSPLWFGNQYLKEENNRTYGTATVLIALAAEASREAVAMREMGLAWLRSTQSPEGGWSGGDPGQPTSVEETALALRALAGEGPTGPVKKGVHHLALLTENGTRFPPSPIGFYFAKLWYWEQLYPVVWTVEALEALEALDRGTRDSKREFRQPTE